jgi:nucleoside-diphosphate-sugar epimerase
MLTHLQPARLPARVVVLGARGFLGSALVRQLAAAGCPCLAPGRDALDLAAPEAAGALAALLRPDDAVVLAAALTPERGRDAATFRRNLLMAETVAGAVAARPVAHVVYLGSDAVYGWQEPLVSEETAPSPADLYGAMHLTRELVLAAAAGAAGVPLAVLRPCAVYGPGDTHDGYGPNRFARTARNEGRIELFGDGEERRDHVLVDDVAGWIRAALGRRSTGRLNLVSGRSVPFAEVARLVAARAGRPVEIVARPRRQPVVHRHFDPVALGRAFPDLPPTPLAEGLAALLSVT